MILRVIDRPGLNRLMEKLGQEATVYAPQEQQGVGHWAFEKVTDPSRVTLEYVSTTLPARQFAFPTRQTILRGRGGEGLSMEAVVEAEPIVLVGVHPCDIYGLQSLDMFYCDEPADPNWAARRAQLRIIGVSCVPDEWCFCASMGTATVDSGYDLFLSRLTEGEYLVEVGTEAGEQMLEGLPVREATAAEITSVKRQLAEKVNQERRLHDDFRNLPLRFSGKAQSPVWEKQAARCTSCGTCVLVCPTCVCFDVRDEVNLGDPAETWRDRVWDGCMLESFAEVASGENFREERFQRLRHRFFRKYAYLFTRFGRPYCCGCGRCVRQCLVHIDPVEIINDLLAESKKEAVTRGA